MALHQSLFVGVFLLGAVAAQACEKGQCTDSAGLCYYCPIVNATAKSADGNKCWTVKTYACVKGAALGKANCGASIDKPETKICQVPKETKP